MKQMIFNVIYVLLLTACESGHEKAVIRKNDLSVPESQQAVVANIDNSIFKGSLRDWFKFGAREGYLFPVYIVEKNRRDSIYDVYLEFNLGAYSIRSSRLGLLVHVPFFAVSELDNDYPCNSLKIYEYYSIKYQSSPMFTSRVSHLACKFEKEKVNENIYQVFQEEIYQPNFETDPVVTGRKVFTISMSEGIIEYELFGKFEEEWY